MELILDQHKSFIKSELAQLDICGHRKEFIVIIVFSANSFT